jgi:hypothetical protein
MEPWLLRQRPCRVLLRRLQELDDLLQLLFSFIDPCDIRKTDLHVVFGKYAVLAPRE